MAYFGDTIAHASLLGVAVSLLSGGAVPMTLAIILVAVAVALILTRFTRDARFQADTLLGILAHSALAFGVLLVALRRDIQVDLSAFLFGDVLAMDWLDVGLLAGLAFVMLLLFRRYWRALLMSTIDPAIAQVEGISPTRMQLLLTLMLAAVIALAIKITGVLLITALLIIPAAAARYLARTPAHMAVLASVVGLVSVTGGLFGSLAIDAPTGPMMVATAALLFVLFALFVRQKN